MTTDLDEIFDALREELARYSPPLTVREGGVRGKRDYTLWSEREVEVAGRRRKELYFGGLIVQKGYVGFYYMPVDAEPERTEIFDPDLLKLLKGKSCFHVKRLDDAMREHIRSALAAGFERWQQRGWI